MRYVFADRTVETTLELPALRVATGEPIARAVRVEKVRTRAHGEVQTGAQQWQHIWRDPHGAVSLTAARRESGYLLRFPDTADFLVDAESWTVCVCPAVDAGDDTLEHLLLDQVLPRLLAHGGALALHASAVLVEDRAVLFVGESGRGKSTLAALLDREGHELLSDDCVLLRCDAAGVRAVPTYTSLRLHGEVADRVCSDLSTDEPRQGWGKRRVRTGGPFRSGGAPVAAIYLLNEAGARAAAPALEPCRPADACVALMRNAFTLDPVDRRQLRERLDRASAAARSVPVCGLAFPHDFDSAGALTGLVAGHVRSLGLQQPCIA